MKRILIAAAFLAAFAANAQSNKPGKSGFDNSPFDISLEVLPANYRGHDCKRFAAALKAAKLSKDEYETSEQYTLRTDAWKSNALVGNVKPIDSIAFRRDPSLHLEYKYNADEKTLNVWTPEVNKTTAVSGKLSNWDAIDVISQKESSYKAANAYGVTRQVSKTESKVCAIALSGVHYVPFQYTLRIENIEPSKAKSIKDNLNIFYVGNIDSPYIGTIYDGTSPSLDIPFETRWTGDAVVMRVKHAWAVDRRTGEVLGKRDF
ncbi:hypothetical protein QRD40_10710 [Comamonas sp. Y6]|uniref:Uncharacterized protein n=1 Tax=Comamonas resistens TaxID=3046670 RepID=A0ABY8SVR6_9BURK|nr:hypothetical protein [Comamonas resistens]MDL5036817.1 hypothetical protein [Comamonas resistens]WHS67127.1 hypothetical protein QMY55_08425 [Comamonas resistens]